MNLVQDSPESAKAREAVESHDSNPGNAALKNTQRLSKAKKRRLRKAKQISSSTPNSHSNNIVESAPHSVEKSHNDIINETKELNPNSTKDKNSIKSDRSNPPTKANDIPSSIAKTKSPCNSSYDQCSKSQNRNNLKVVPKANTLDDNIKAAADNSECIASELLKTSTSESINDKNLPLDGSSAIAGRLAIVERLFDSPAFSHIVDRIQAGTETRLGEENRRPLVSAETETIPQKLENPGKMNTKSREDVIAEREAKKAAKAAAKAAKSKPKVSSDGANKIAECAKIEKENIGCGKTTVPTHQEIVSSNDVVDGAFPAFKAKFVQLTNQQEPNIKRDFSSLIDDVKTSVPIANEKSKAELKAERRAKQEAQRAAKAAAKNDDAAQIKKTDEGTDKQRKPAKEQDIIKEKVDGSEESNVLSSDSQYMIKLFSHLRLNKERFKHDYTSLHPAIIRLGIQYESRIVCGSNARCVALLHAFRKVLSDYSTPSKQEFSRGLESVLAKSMAYIEQCRPASVSMVNAVRHIKRHLTQIPITLSDLQAKQKLYDVIDTYVREQIDVAGEAISNTVQKKITNGDVILTYGCSSLVRRIFTESHKSGTQFSVIVADGAPWFEGREMLKRLVKDGLNCSYVPISATSFVMREVSKVVLGAHALLANGCVVSRAGASQLALLARSYNVAVLVCCETHKFSERVQTDAFVYNELDGGDVKEQKEKRLSLVYDVTPPDLVTAVVTELGILPCTSVPVILRIKPSETVV